MGDGFVIGKLPADAFCIRIKAVEASGFVEAVTFEPSSGTDAAPEHIPLSMDQLRQEGITFCSHQCRKRSEAPTCGLQKDYPWNHLPDDRKGKQEGKIVDDANVKDPFADSPWEKRSDNGGDVAASNTNTNKLRILKL